MSYHYNRLLSLEPEDGGFLPVAQKRRASRLLRMAMTAAGICLRDAGVTTPDVIITGTGLGMMEDFERFFSAMIIKKERLLNPTPFIQSVHNTVGATLAIQWKCHDLNLDFTHNFLSFESALTAARMRLAERPLENVLVGGLEAISETHFKNRESAGDWKKEPIENLQLLRTSSPGTIAGEGVAFFLLTARRDPANQAQIRDVRTLYRPGGEKEVREAIGRFLDRNRLSWREVDLMLLGLNGDRRHDQVYHSLRANCFPRTPQAAFKHLCGEHYVASSFALWLAARVLKTQRIPPAVRLPDSPEPADPLRNILIYNQNKNLTHSLILVSANEYPSPGQMRPPEGQKTSGEKGSGI